MTYQEEKEKILDWIVNRVEWSVNLPGAIPIDREKQKEAKAEASLLLDELVKKMVIGEDEKPVPIVPGTWMKSSNWQGFRAMERFRNDLRALQRQVMEKGEDDE